MQFRDKVLGWQTELLFAVGKAMMLAGLVFTFYLVVGALCPGLNLPPGPESP